MSAISGPTAIYLLLYLITWVLHFLLASAVLVGAFYVALATWRGRRGLVDDIGAALPLLLGLAITAGVGPLLFVQILYRDAFYTANLLLYIRFVAILPALLGCFYLFYFLRTDRAKAMPHKRRALLALLAALFALFVAVSWVELHTLSLEPSTWIERYANGEHSNLTGDVALRLAALLAVAVAVAAVVFLAIARFQGRDGAAVVTMAPMAAAGALASLAFAALYARTLGSSAISSLTSGVGGVHTVLFVVASLASAVVWAVIASGSRISSGLCRFVYVLAAVWLWSLAVVRESIRTSRLELADLAVLHERAFDTGGQIAFVAFALLNTALIAWCARLIWRVWRDARAR